MGGLVNGKSAGQLLHFCTEVCLWPETMLLLLLLLHILLFLLKQNLAALDKVVTSSVRLGVVTNLL